MRYTEDRLQYIMGELVQYMRMENMNHSVWDDIVKLEKDVESYIEDAHKYQNNTFQSHPEYYINYFEMRLQQCTVLHNLHYQMKKLRYMPEQALIIADYVYYMKKYAVEHNVPSQQIQRLNEIFEEMKQQPLPISRDEFENRAILYHILLDLEEFLVFKKRFIESLGDVQKEIYWEKTN